jgi:hypothetical protein
MDGRRLAGMPRNMNLHYRMHLINRIFSAWIWRGGDQDIGLEGGEDVGLKVDGEVEEYLFYQYFYHYKEGKMLVRVAIGYLRRKKNYAVQA